MQYLLADFETISPSKQLSVEINGCFVLLLKIRGYIMTTDTINIKGYDVVIKHDIWEENPRDWDICSSTLVTAHKRYSFGGVALTRCANSIEDAFQQHLADKDLTEKDVIFLEVYMFDHSGIALSTTPFGCRWDSGQLGFIYEKRSDIREEFNVKRISKKLEQRIYERLDSEVNLLGHWANGEVFCFTVDGETYGGFYGFDHQKSGLFEAAAEAVDAIRRYKVRKHTERLKQLIKSGVSLQYRPTLNLEAQYETL